MELVLLKQIKGIEKMAQFTKANGDFQPVFHQDAASYTNGGLKRIHIC